LTGFDLKTFIQAVGYLGIFGIIFAESGFFFGFFFPGDSLLFTAGFLASQGFFNIGALVAGSFIAAVAGVSFGYAVGRRLGEKVFTKEEGIFFHKKNLERARIFYEKYGKKAIVFARFVPVIRSFAPTLAGVGKMNYPSFIFYNIIGGALWAGGFLLLGYFLGNTIPDADRYLLPIIALIIIISFVPVIIHFIKEKKQK